MGYSSHVGSFNIDTAKEVGQTQAITGCGFTPKIVLFWWSGSTATGDTVAGGTYNIGFGAGYSTSDRFYVVTISEDAQASSDTYRTHNNDKVIAVYSDADTIDGALDFSSMDADGFTLIIDDQFANAYRISYLALGGDDLTNVYIGATNTASSIGNYNVSGVGFQPEALIIVTDFGAGEDGIFSLGMATGLSNQGVISVDIVHGMTTMYTEGYGYNGEIIAKIFVGEGTTRESFVSFGADGFTLNHLEGSTNFNYYYIALKGGQYSVGDITTRTDGNDISETIGFQPVALLFGSVNRALSTQDVSTSNARISIGSATATDHRAVAAISDEDNLADSETAYANYDSAVYANILDDAIVGLMDLKSIESDGFTCVMDDTDPAGCWVMYLAIGAESGEGCVNVVVETESVSVTVPIVVVDFCEV